MSAPSRPYPFWLGGVATGLASTCTHPLDLCVRCSIELPTDTWAESKCTRFARSLQSHSVSYRQMQTHQGRAGVFGTLASVLRTKGPLGLFDGLSGAWYRALTYNLARFEFYAMAQRYLKEQNSIQSSLARNVAAGIFAGVLGGAVANPGGTSSDSRRLATDMACRYCLDPHAGRVFEAVSATRTSFMGYTASQPTKAPRSSSGASTCPSSAPS
jgi:hypothetical protein